MAKKFFLPFIFSLILFNCNAYNTVNTKAKIRRLATLSAHLNRSSENEMPYFLYEELQTLVQELIEITDQKEKSINALKRRNDRAQQIAQHRAATEKKSYTAPLLSFVIPCYNRANVVHATIESIYSQNLTVPFEVVATDDASKDETFKVLQEYEKKYDNFFAYKNDTNKGAPTTRNSGVLHARGTYICNADSDDIFEPNSIEPMLTGMMQKNYQVCYFQFMTPFYETPSNPIAHHRSDAPNNEFDLAQLLTRDIYTSNSGNRIFTKKSWLSVGGYIEKPGHDSWSLSFRFLSHGLKGYIHPDSGYCYKVWENRSSMWWQDQLHKVNDVSPLAVVRENLELFTVKSQRELLLYNEPDAIFITSYVKKLMLLSEETLNAIFDAYNDELNENYLSAYSNYEKAIKTGATHHKLYLKRVRAAIATKQPILIKQALNNFFKNSITIF